MELKFPQPEFDALGFEGSNRTFMELKYKFSSVFVTHSSSSNRTFMELKLLSC